MTCVVFQVADLAMKRCVYADLVNLCCCMAVWHNGNRVPSKLSSMIVCPIAVVLGVIFSQVPRCAQSACTTRGSIERARSPHANKNNTE